MNDEQTNKTDTAREEVTTNLQTSSEEPSAMEKLKASNDEMAKEIARSRELQKESQEIEAQKMLSGTTGGHVDSKPKEISDADYANRVMAGDVPDGE